MLLNKALLAAAGVLIIPDWTKNTLDPDNKNSYITLSSGNLRADHDQSTNGSIGVRAINPIPAGSKRYWEIYIGENTNREIRYGICTVDYTFNGKVGDDAYGWGIYIYSGQKYHNAVLESCGSEVEQGSYAMVAVDMELGYVWFGDDGTWFDSGNPAAGTNPHYTGLSGDIYPAVSLYDTDNWVRFNFGATAFINTKPSGFNA